MHKTLAALLLPVLVGGSSLAPIPVKWSVVGGNGPIIVRPGQPVVITIQADIDKGWHIYSLTQKPGGPVPLTIRLVGAADVVLRGPVKAPPPRRTVDKNFGIETELHSGSPRFTLTVGVPAGSLTGVRKLHIAARYQVCSATLCLPARTEKIPLTLRIAKAK